MCRKFGEILTCGFWFIPASMIELKVLRPTRPRTVAAESRKYWGSESMGGDGEDAEVPLPPRGSRDSTPGKFLVKILHFGWFYIRKCAHQRWTETSASSNT